MSSNKNTFAKKEKVQKPGPVPKLRFPEFQKLGGWVNRTLGSMAIITTERVGEKHCVPMSITSGIGLVSQVEKFGRVIAGSSYASYILLKKNDFAYNKSATKEYPEGFIALYSGTELAAVPKSIFTCFRIIGDSPRPEYLNYLFLGNLHGKWLRNFIEVGARAHGSLSIDENDLLDLPVPVPSGTGALREQQKIAECLSSLDELIAAQSRKVDTLKAHKKGLMQQLFPREGETQPRLRFPEFQNAGEWVEKTIGDVCKLKAGEFVSASAIVEAFKDGLFPCYGGNGLRGYVQSSTHEGTFVLIGRQGALCGNVTLVHGKFHATEHALVVSPANGVATNWLHYALDWLNLNRFAIGQAQPGLSVGVLNNVALAMTSEESEQQRIADCLATLDELIAGQTQTLAALKTHKNGLLQQLFPTAEATES
jgi:type I restriction enzyme S subunit